MKKCPYCAEEIQDEAIVCRYCGRELIKVRNEKKDNPFLMNLGIVIYCLVGIYGLVLCFGFMMVRYGFLTALIATLFLPVEVIIIPWLILLGTTNPVPLIFIYGGGILGTIIFRYGSSGED